LAADVVGEGCPRVVEERGQAAVEEVDGLALELALPDLVALEDRLRAGSERAVVEERDLGIEEELASELLRGGRGHGLLLLHPEPPPTRGPVKRVASRVTRESWLRHESPAIANRLSPPARRRSRFRPPVPVAWLHMHEGTWTLADCPPDAQAALVRELGISELTAAVLVRRGYSDPAVASRFLDGEQPPHDPFLLGDMEAACAQIRAAVEQGRRICVHGDYDVDGIAATTLAVLLLRELGAEVAWHLPSRFDEGYGVRSETLARLAGDGCGLVLTVDCGITAVAEVAEARERGLDVVVTDHHRPAETLPDCPIVATRPSEYPFPELCGTGVVHKLGQALFGVDSEIPRRHLDLVALATIADVVPLIDENRSLAIAGLRALARTAKPGLRALMQSAGVDPATVDAGAVGFRLAPRLNAAGRLGHPREALELLLTEDEAEARRLADSLEELNRERQAVEGRILREAVAQVEAWPPEQRARRAYAVAGADWHEGVIGIVASRLVERYHRPVVLIAGTDGDWKGSGRSIPTFDLHAALGACAGLLGRWGGHRAAAGLSIAEENVDAFAEAFAEQAATVLDEEDLAPLASIDAVVARGADLSLDLCAELARLAPFGLGNPAPTLLAPGCGLAELATVGDGKHLRFRVRRDGRDAGSAIAFGQGSRLEVLRPDALYDVAFRLEENHWNGTVSPQLVVRRIFGASPRYPELRAWLAAEWKKPESARDAEAAAIFDELRIVEGGPRRDLLESARFRALLAAEPPLAAAA
jgi:single-stranded-DNA-specific exonuclease